jgi:hypothetical protein
VVVPEKQGLKLSFLFTHVLSSKSLSGGSRKTRIETWLTHFPEVEHWGLSVVPEKQGLKQYKYKIINSICQV